MITSTIAKHLPAALRRRRLHSQTRRWANSATPRPFGRARAVLQAWLQDTTRTTERDLAAIWHDQLAALEGGLREAQRHHRLSEQDTGAALILVGERISTVESSLRRLETLLRPAKTPEHRTTPEPASGNAGARAHHRTIAHVATTPGGKQCQGSSDEVGHLMTPAPAEDQP